MATKFSYIQIRYCSGRIDGYGLDEEYSFDSAIALLKKIDLKPVVKISFCFKDDNVVILRCQNDDTLCWDNWCKLSESDFDGKKKDIVAFLEKNNIVLPIK